MTLRVVHSCSHGPPLSHPQFEAPGRENPAPFRCRGVSGPDSDTPGTADRSRRGRVLGGRTGGAGCDALSLGEATVGSGRDPSPGARPAPKGPSFAERRIFLSIKAARSSGASGVPVVGGSDRAFVSAADFVRPSKVRRTSSHSSGRAALPLLSNARRNASRHSLTTPARVFPIRRAVASSLAIMSSDIRTGIGWVSATGSLVYEAALSVHRVLDIVYQWYTVRGVESAQDQPGPDSA